VAAIGGAQPDLRHPRRGHGFLWVAIISVCLVGAGGIRGADPDEGAELSALKRSVVANYAALASAVYEEALARAGNLQTAIGAFLDKPSEQSLKAAREAWVAARGPYSQTEAFRFYDGPIDGLEAKINSWPIDEHYIDYVAGDPNAGIINDPIHFPALSRELIVTLNEKEGKKNISTGFHAIEFLLWGQDRSANGPGDRSWRDYADGAKHAERRREYLRIVTALLVENLETIAAAWREGNASNYRAEFVAKEPNEALANILKGVGALSGPELAGERLTTPYETKEQEEEQDCFSDNTCNDLIDDALGIQNVYLGRYEGKGSRQVHGPGLHQLLARVDPALAGRLALQVEAAVASARGIPHPFDQSILGADNTPGRVAIKQAVTAFQTQSDLFARAAMALGLKLNL
jgi:putative iron-regulated protein